jgi:hypothetical protein
MNESHLSLPYPPSANTEHRYLVPKELVTQYTLDDFILPSTLPQNRSFKLPNDLVWSA